MRRGVFNLDLRVFHRTVLAARLPYTECISQVHLVVDWRARKVLNTTAHTAANDDEVLAVEPEKDTIKP
jgi:hypothetical protein